MEIKILALLYMQDGTVAITSSKDFIIDNQVPIIQIPKGELLEIRFKGTLRILGKGWKGESFYYMKGD